MLAASHHVTGAGGAPVPAIGAPAPSVAPAVGLEDHCIRPFQPFRPFEGRAPPARPSA
jgi:hypothetical protein